MPTTKKADLAVVDNEPKELLVLDESFDHLETGLEDVSKEDMAIPLLQILQALSPQVNKRDGAYVEGAEAGFIYNSVTATVYDGEEGVNVIPCAYRKAYVEWAPRDTGLGLIKEHESRSILDMAIKDDKGKYVLDNGNYIEETAYFYVLMEDENGSISQAVIPMKSSQLTKARKWVTTMKMQTRLNSKGQRVPAPMFMNRYRLTTVHQQNDMGNWYGWGIALHGPLSADDRDLVETAMTFSKAVKSNEVKVQQEEQAGGSTSGDTFDAEDIM